MYTTPVSDQIQNSMKRASVALCIVKNKTILHSLAEIYIRGLLRERALESAIEYVPDWVQFKLDDAAHPWKWQVCPCNLHTLLLLTGEQGRECAGASGAVAGANVNYMLKPDGRIIISNKTGICELRIFVDIKEILVFDPSRALSGYCWSCTYLPLPELPFPGFITTAAGI